MITLLGGVIVAALVLYVLKQFAKADPKRLAQSAKKAGGAALLLVAAFLAMRGHFETAIPLAIFGLSLIGWSFSGLLPGGRNRKRAGRASSVKTPFLDMMLDHDSGRLSGKVTGGSYAGRELDTIELPALARLASEVDAESRRLLEAYLDRRAPGWREDAQGDTGGRSTRAPGHGPMTEQEAYEILGLQPGAGPDDIGKAHRGLMKKLHPDQGGSNYLAARVNEAKDILMRGHRRQTPSS
ncbi:MAG: heat shock protein DnaJ domain protein [Microvirga sp.]|jgi:hypothetical protein|nr:heat shock protein DnaJ domain protein [Microvirga sp.]